MITLWLEGTTPHVDEGVRIETDEGTLSSELATEEGWMYVKLVKGGTLALRPGRVIAYEVA